MTINDLNHLKSSLIPVEQLAADGSPAGLASVLVPLLPVDNEWHILLTQRSSQLRHHAGEVAFPGGMWEEGDEFPVTTALRESEEEIALPRTAVSLLGGLEEIETGRQTRVFPVVGQINESTDLTPNAGEIAAIFTVPLSFFLDDQRLRTDVFSREQRGISVEHWVPAYQYEGYEIWGFTAAVIVRLMNRGFDAGIGREHHAREKIW